MSFPATSGLGNTVSDGALSFEAVVTGAFNEIYSSEKIRQVLEDSLAYGLDAMRQVCPVKTGFLKSSLGYNVTDDESGELFADAPYAFFVNDGTTRMSAQPFFDYGVAACEDRLRSNLNALR